MADGNFSLKGCDGCEVDMDLVSSESFDVLLQDLGPDFSSLCLCANSEDTKSEEKTSGADSPSSGGSSFGSFCQKYDDIKIGCAGVSEEKYTGAEGPSSGGSSFGSFCQKYDDIKIGSVGNAAEEGHSSKEESCLGLSSNECMSECMSDFSVISSASFGKEDEDWFIVEESFLGDEPKCDTELPYDENGLDINGMDIEGFDLSGVDESGFNRHGFDSDGYDRRGFDVNGVHKNGSPYNECGHDKDGYDKCDYLFMFKDRHYNN